MIQKKSLRFVLKSSGLWTKIELCIMYMEIADQSSISIRGFQLISLLLLKNFMNTLS